MTFEQRKTPGDQTRGIPNSHHSHHDGATSSIADSREFFAYQLHGLHVAVVEIKSPGPEKRFRRYYFANLPSAQRRVDKAREEGREAHLYLGQIHIVAGDPR